MAIRKEQSSYNDSLTLKTAMVSKGLLDPMEVGHVYYSGSSAEKHLLMADNGDNTFRTIVRLSGGNVDFDHMDKDDPLAVRMFVKRELDVYIYSIDGVEDAFYTLNGSIYTHTIVYNGVTYVATDSKLVDAVAKSLTSMINAVPNLKRVN